MQKPLKIAVLDMYNSFPGEGMRCILALINEFQVREQLEISTQVFDVRTKNEIPDLSFDVFISSGGPGSPLESDEAWEKPYFELIDNIFTHNKSEAVQNGESTKKFLFLICHSFQLVSRHLGIGKVTKRRSTSFGVFPVNQIDKNIKEELFDGLPEPFYVVDSRDYQLVTPNKKRIHDLDVTILRMEKERPHVNLERAIMAIRFSKEVFGTQFHPEADAIGMLKLLSSEEKKKAVIKTHGLEKYNDMIDKLDDPDKILLTESIIIPTFLKLASESILQLEVA
ncbi:MAG: GMP synthase [Arcicella sp.]|jgi:GMP synthase-like glutamine amidotransferase|nr:GMP synthase [Arcicella sp.]